MALFEVLTLRVGGAIAKSLLKLWLKDSAIAQDVSTDISDLLLGKVPVTIQMPVARG